MYANQLILIDNENVKDDKQHKYNATLKVIFSDDWDKLTDNYDGKFRNLVSPPWHFIWIHKKIKIRFYAM